MQTASVDISDFRRIRSNEWHSSATTQRVVEEAEACNCFDTGRLCSDEQCINRGLSVECNASVCDNGEQCQNQRMQRAKYPKVRREHLPHALQRRAHALRAASSKPADACMPALNCTSLDLLHDVRFLVGAPCICSPWPAAASVPAQVWFTCTAASQNSQTVGN